MKLTHQMLRDIAQFTGSHYMAKCFDIFRAVFIRRLLGPLTMGLFTELTLVYQYGKLSHLGVLNALDREIPLFRGKADQGRVQLIQSVSFTACAFLALVAAVLIGLCGFLPVSLEFRRGLIFIAVLTFMTSFLSYYRVLLRTHNEFGLLSRVTIIGSVVETILAVILVIRWGIQGLLLAMILGNLAGILWIVCSRRQLLKIPLGLDWGCLKTLFGVGIPLALHGFIRTIFVSVERILILVFLGRIYLGFYSVALMVYNFATPFSVMAYNVIYPRFMEAFGKTGELKRVESYLTRPTLVFGYLYPVVAGAGVLALPFLLNYLLPQFSPGLIPAQILLWATCCFSLIFMWGYALVALGKQWLLIGLNIASILFEMGFCWLFTGVLGWGLNGIAAAIFIAHFLLSLLMMTSVIWGYQQKKIECVRFLADLYLSLAGAMICVWLLHEMIPYSFVSLWQDLGLFLLQVFLLLAVWGSLMFFRLNRKIPVLKILKEWRISGSKARPIGEEISDV